MENMPTWAAVLLAFVTLLGGGVGTWLYNLYQARNKQALDEAEQKSKNELADRKQTSELKMSENEQAFRMYTAMLDALRTTVNKTSEDMNKLEAQHLLCREESAGLKTENRVLIKENEILRKELEDLKKPRKIDT